MKSISGQTLVFLGPVLLLLGCTVAVAPSTSVPASPAAVAVPTKPAWQGRWDAAVAGAKKEGQLVIYTIAGPSVRTGLGKAFREKYGVEVEFVAGQTAEIANKLITEKERGLKFGDAVIAGGGTLLTVLKPKGILATLEPFLIVPEVTDNKLWIGEELFHDKDKTGVGFLSYYTRPAFRNTDMVKEEQITSYSDLLRPQWKGKIIMEDPTITGSTLSWTAGLVREWGLERTKEYLRQLVKQEPVLSRDPRNIREVVARGKYPVGISARPEVMVEFLAMGAPLANVKVRDMSKMTPSTGVISLTNEPAHLNAATVFVNWLLTREGQVTASKAWGLPSGRLDTSREGFHPSFFPGADEKYFVQDEEDYLTQGKMIEVNREIFGPLMK